MHVFAGVRAFSALNWVMLRLAMAKDWQQNGENWRSQVIGIKLKNKNSKAIFCRIHPPPFLVAVNA